jgi:2-keto-4-pentenoate hydratase/2-oxohepta-3-ene-1,7-dioic acid hydratase in catechol pathway
MRWIRFTAEDRTRYGILEGDRILEVSGSPFDEYEKTSRKHDLSAVKIEVPVMPRTFYCAGLNYVEHVKEGPPSAAKCRISQPSPIWATAPAMR